MMYFMIDFDGTIFNGHSHNDLNRLIKNNPELEGNSEAQWARLKSAGFVGDPQKWREALTTLLNRGDKVAVVSFSAYPGFIECALKDIFGTSDLYKNITIVAGTPANPEKDDKENHIQRALDLFGRGQDFNPKDVILIDDSEHNYKSAEKKGHRSIWATENGSHIEKMLEITPYDAVLENLLEASGAREALKCLGLGPQTSKLFFDLIRQGKIDAADEFFKGYYNKKEEQIKNKNNDNNNNNNHDVEHSGDEEDSSEDEEQNLAFAEETLPDLIDAVREHYENKQQKDLPVASDTIANNKITLFAQPHSTEELPALSQADILATPGTPTNDDLARFFAYIDPETDDEASDRLTKRQRI